MTGVGRIADGGRPEFAQPPLDQAIAELAGRQHGVVGSVQLEAIGLSGRGVRHRAATGRLHRIHRGVYAVGHRLMTAEGRWMAAVLACGPGAVLSHRDAGALHGLRPNSRARIEVTVPGRTRVIRPGIEAHRSVSLESAKVEGIPCTTVPRTLLDLADVIDRRGVERAIDRAEQLRVFDLTAIEGVLLTANGRRGAAVLRAALGEHEPELTRSELEERFLELCRMAGLPSPEVNVELCGIEVDFLWRDQRLVVETDGYATHGTRTAFERDRHRDQLLLRAGYRVVRFTWRQVVEGSAAEVLSQLLRRPS